MPTTTRSQSTRSDSLDTARPFPDNRRDMLARIEWLYHIPGVEPLLQQHWERIGALFIGEKIALAVLAAVVMTEAVVAANRFMAMEFAWPKPRKSVKKAKREKGFGLKKVALL